MGDRSTEIPDATSVLYTDFDNEHSLEEDRWVSVGRSSEGTLLLVIHTFTSTGPSTALVRIISARAATRHERQQYELGTS